MSMVTETRRVVEDYVLHRIQLSYPEGRIELATLPMPVNPPSEISKAVRNTATEFEERYKKAFPDLLEGIRSNHIGACDVDRVFTRITKDLFGLSDDGNGHAVRSLSPSVTRNSKDPSSTVVDSVPQGRASNSLNDTHIKWGHVVGLLVFAGLLAVRSIETNVPDQVDIIVNWVSVFLDTKLGNWLEKQGGWHNFVEWYRHRPKSESDSWFSQVVGTNDGIRTAMRVGAMAAFIGLGAMMMSRR